MAASHPSIDTIEPKGSTGIERAGDGERPRSVAPPMSSAASDARLQAALSATSRADASLSTLMRAVRDLTSGVSSAREANVALVAELGALADLLGAANERQLALKNRVSLLEQALEKHDREAKSERDYILEQQDAFIVGMLEDHEHVVAELRRELEATRERVSQRPTASPGSLSSFEIAASSSVAPPPAPPTDPAPAPDVRLELEVARHDIERLLQDRERTRETLLKLQAQRDEAQAAVVKLTRERDLARAEGAQNRIGVAVRQAIPIHTPTPTPAGRMASTLPPPESPRVPPSSSPSHAVPSSRPGSSRKRPTTDPGGIAVERSIRNTNPMPVTARPRAPALELSPRELRTPSPPPEELRAAIHPPTTPLPPAPLMTPPPPTPRGPEAKLAEESAASAPPPTSKKPKADSSIRPGGGYSITNSVAPERVNTSGITRPKTRP
ncbi:MAG TPA: hypothetical protein VF103_09765 [Polyangiaceae bacterium]